MTYPPPLRSCAYGLALAALAVCGGCGGGDEPSLTSSQDAIARDRAAMHFRKGQTALALQDLAPLLEREDAALEDILRAMNTALAGADFKLGHVFAERASAIDPDNLVLRWGLYRMAYGEGWPEKALEQARFVHERRPDDYQAHYAYASCLHDLERYEEAEKECRKLLEIDLDHSGDWRLITLHRMYRILVERNKEQEADLFLLESNRLEDEGRIKPTGADIDQGSFGAVAPASLARTTFAPPLSPPPMRPGSKSLELAGVLGLVPFTPSLTLFPKDGSILPWIVPGEIVEPAWIVLGASLAVVTRTPDGTLSAQQLAKEPASVARSLDTDRDGDADIVAALDGNLVLFTATDAGYQRRAEPLAALGGRVSDLETVDFDHDGDLDLLTVGDFGTRILRDDGVKEGGVFSDATAEAGLPAERAYRYCIFEDFDGDNDVDLLVGGPIEPGVPPLFLASNLRGGAFADASARIPAELAGLLARVEPLVADLDCDARPDMYVPGGTPSLWLATASGSFEARSSAPELAAGPATLVDFDLDGALDVVGANQGLQVVLAAGLDVARVFSLQGPPSEITAFACADHDGDGSIDAMVYDGAALSEFLGTPGGKSIGLALLGAKDNERGVGATVEVRAGEFYRRIYWRGEPQRIGLGANDRAAVLRVTWPRGVVMDEIDVLPGDYAMPQRRGIEGSCPFLYAWNGSEYTFVTDVLGITPLGLSMAPGMLVPPDHDEYVLVRGGELAPQDGFYALQFTEELREVTYLDRVRLEVVDHPAGTEVFPNERFTFPPFPEAHIHSVRDPLVPRRASDQAGMDWTAELASNDKRYAIPFEPHAKQFTGLASPHTLELAFDAEPVRTAAKLRLVANGWFFWTDASVNLAAARHPSIHFVPPILSVPDGEGGEGGEGGWRECGPIGFPAGKLKTIVFDVTELLNREDPRIRLSSTLRLYWDSIRLAVDADDAELVVASIEPASALLSERGFSKAIFEEGEHALEWFDWDVKEDFPRWNQHPGLYTKFGEVLPLLGSIDDMFVILGAGDCLTLRFPAEGVPPPMDGFVRDYLVFLDGWAKDRDPNTLEALFVEPLPFHGMSGYPYATEEHYPDDEAHRLYRRTWNTRAAKRWIQPLVGAR